MAHAPLRLFVDADFHSPYAMSVFVTLHEKKLPFEVETIDLNALHHLRPNYRAHSVTARIPALEHDELSLSESSAITEYLEEVFSPPSYAAAYPDEPVARARARQVQAWLRSDLLPIRNERPTSDIFEAPSGKVLSEEAKGAARKLFEASEALLNRYGASLFGEWCIADTDLALMLNRLVCNGDTVPRNLAAYAQKQWERPSVQAWVAANKENAERRAAADRQTATRFDGN